LSLIDKLPIGPTTCDNDCRSLYVSRQDLK
jgi:hypothetical protein